MILSDNPLFRPDLYFRLCESPGARTTCIIISTSVGISRNVKISDSIGINIDFNNINTITISGIRISTCISIGNSIGIIIGLVYELVSVFLSWYEYY